MVNAGGKVKTQTSSHPKKPGKKAHNLKYYTEPKGKHQNGGWKNKRCLLWKHFCGEYLCFPMSLEAHRPNPTKHEEQSWTDTSGAFNLARDRQAEVTSSGLEGLKEVGNH